MALNKNIGALAAIAVLAASGCTSGNSRIEPPFQSANPLTYKLEFAVGTANYQVVDGTCATPVVDTITGLNTVETYRQPNGLSGTLVNSPSIFGPTGFLVPAGSAEAGDDAGTASITSTPQSVQPGAVTPPNTFGQAGGVFAYGFLPVNSTNNAESGNNGYTPYGQPFFTDAFSAGGTDISSVYLGGPPAYTNVQTGTYPGGFVGFTQGFNSFASTLAAGTYTLSMVVPTSPTKTGTLTAAAALTSMALLPTYGPPAVLEDGTGGATFTVTVPAGVTETLLDVVDLGAGSATAVDCHGAYSAPFYYTVVDHTPGPATVTMTLPDAVGPIPPTGGAAEPTLCTGDAYVVNLVGTDYDAYEAGPGQSDPNGSSETPTIVGASGQADITVSFPAATASGLYDQSAMRQAERLRPARLRSMLHINTFHHASAFSRRR
jgi:hypothetical protein